MNNNYATVTAVELHNNNNKIYFFLDLFLIYTPHRRMQLSIAALFLCPTTRSYWMFPRCPLVHFKLLPLMFRYNYTTIIITAVPEHNVL